VQCVKYSPNGDVFVSAGSDGKLFVYEGKEGEKIAEMTQNGHTGTIYSVGFSQDSKKLITCSADSTVKLWDVSTQQLISTCDFSDSFANAVDSQQVGCLWTKDHMLSVSLNGEINYFNEQTFNAPSRIVRVCFNVDY